MHMSGRAWEHAMVHLWRSEDNVGNSVSPSIVWALGIELMLSRDGRKDMDVNK